MSSAVRMTLMIGPAVPIPVPKEVLDALTSVEVFTTSGTSASGFELTFTVSTNSPLHTLFMLSGGSLLPIVRVVIVVTFGGITEVLIDGVMTEHSTTPGKDGKATLTVRGKDLTAVMDYIEFNGLPYPAMPDAARVLVILAKYAFLGIIPMVIPSVLLDIPIPIDRIPTHQGTDLTYIKSLADNVGYVFYLKPGPAPGTSVAYWGPEIKVGAPQPALNINMDAHTNVEALDFSFDTEQAELPVVIIHEPKTKAPIPIPIPAITPLNPPLGVVPPIPKQLRFIDTATKLNPIAAVAIGLAKAAQTADAVTANGSLNVVRYGRILKARELVGVRGAGPAFDGLYYVKSVKHQIKRGEYKQSFTLGRNGLLSTIPRVPA